MTWTAMKVCLLNSTSRGQINRAIWARSSLTDTLGNHKQVHRLWTRTRHLANHYPQIKATLHESAIGNESPPSQFFLCDISLILYTSTEAETGDGVLGPPETRS